MQLMHKSSRSPREPAGLEWRILMQLPLLALAGLAIPLLCFGYAYLFPDPVAGESIEKHLTSVAIAATAVTLTVWTAAFTLAIACAVVWIMKGPAYTADSYPLSDADQPRATSTRQDRSAEQ